MVYSSVSDPDPLHLAGSGSTSIPAPDPDPDQDPLRFLSSDPDPDPRQNEMDPKRWFIVNMTNFLPGVFHPLKNWNPADVGERDLVAQQEGPGILEQVLVQPLQVVLKSRPNDANELKKKNDNVCIQYRGQ